MEEPKTIAVELAEWHAELQAERERLAAASGVLSAQLALSTLLRDGSNAALEAQLETVKELTKRTRGFATGIESAVARLTEDLEAIKTRLRDKTGGQQRE